MKILAAREYAGDVVKWVWGAKYKGTPRNGIRDAIEAVESFADYPVPAELGDRDLVIPVPGRIGGKTHALAPRLAEAVASRLDIPVVNVMGRTRRAPPMRRMGPAERKKNVKGLFAVAAPETVKGRRVLVVDDVSTTGATLEEMGRVLLKAGAADVVGLVLAKVKKKKGAPVAKKKRKKKAKKKRKKKAEPAPERGPAGAVKLHRVDIPVKDERATVKLARHMNRVAWIERAWGEVFEDTARVSVQLYARDAADAVRLVEAGRKATTRRPRRRRW